MFLFDVESHDKGIGKSERVPVLMPGLVRIAVFGEVCPAVHHFIRKTVVCLRHGAPAAVESVEVISLSEKNARHAGC